MEIMKALIEDELSRAFERVSGNAPSQDLVEDIWSFSKLNRKCDRCDIMIHTHLVITSILTSSNAIFEETEEMCFRNKTDDNNIDLAYCRKCWNGRSHVLLCVPSGWKGYPPGHYFLKVDRCMCPDAKWKKGYADCTVCGYEFEF